MPTLQIYGQAATAIKLGLGTTGIKKKAAAPPSELAVLLAWVVGKVLAVSTIWNRVLGAMGLEKWNGLDVAC